MTPEGPPALSALHSPFCFLSEFFQHPCLSRHTSRLFPLSRFQLMASFPSSLRKMQSEETFMYSHNHASMLTMRLLTEPRPTALPLHRWTPFACTHPLLASEGAPSFQQWFPLASMSSHFLPLLDDSHHIENCCHISHSETKPS